MDDSNTIITAFLIFLIFLVFSLDGVFTFGGRNNRITYYNGKNANSLNASGHLLGWSNTAMELDYCYRGDVIA